MNTDFLPNFLKAELDNIILTEDSFTRFHKIVHFNMYVLKFVTAILYGILHSSDVKYNKIDKYLTNNFRIPTEGTWFKLFELILTEVIDNKYKSMFLRSIKDEYSKRLNLSYSKNIHNTFNNAESLNVKEFFEKVTTIKNRFISHRKAPNEIAQEFENILIPLTSTVLSTLEDIFSISGFLIKEYSFDNDIKSTLLWGYLSKTVSKTYIDDYWKDDGVYLLHNKKLIYISPFIIVKDGHVLFYDKLEKEKANYTSINDKSLYIKTDCADPSSFFMIDNVLSNLEPLLVDIKTENGITHNLPSKDYYNFIGRVNELKLLEHHVLHRHFITALDGIGGVGKSAITLEFCYRILKESQKKYIYEYIVWVSAKSTCFVNGNIQVIDNPFKHLDQLLDVILDVLAFGEYKSYRLETKTQEVIKILGITRVLLIIDNLETIEKDNLSMIFNFINDLPEPTKIILTSRENIKDIPLTIRIEKLVDSDAEILIEEILKHKYPSLNISNEIKKKIIEISSGLPIAISSFLSQLNMGMTYKSIKKAVADNKDDLAKFCFEQQLKELNDDHKKVLLLICLSADNLSYDALSYMLNEELEDNLSQLIHNLHEKSLITINKNIDVEVFTILPIVKKYIQNYFTDRDTISHLEDKLSKYYELLSIYSFNPVGISQKNITKAILIPKKLADQAMWEAENSHIDEAEQLLYKAIKDYPDESYVWYTFALFCRKYKRNNTRAIEYLKKAALIEPNYQYYKLIGELYLGINNYNEAENYYVLSRKYTNITEYRNEIEFWLGTVAWEKVKRIRYIARKDTSLIIDRNESYRKVIRHYEKYLEFQKNINEGKRANIYRRLSESHYALHNFKRALDFIDQASEIAPEENNHLEFRDIIIKSLQ